MEPGSSNLVGELDGFLSDRIFISRGVHILFEELSTSGSHHNEHLLQKLRLIVGSAVNKLQNQQETSSRRLFAAV